MGHWHLPGGFELFFAVLIGLAQIARGDSGVLTEAQLSQKLRQYQSIVSVEAPFKQIKTIKDMGLEIKSEGIFSLKRPRQVRWEILKPSPVLISMNDREIVLKTGTKKESHTQTFKFDEIPSTKIAGSMTGLMAWLDLNSKDLYRQYEVFADGDNRFKFIPRDKTASPFLNLVMKMNNKGLVEKVDINEVSGDSMSIVFGQAKIMTKNP